MFMAGSIAFPSHLALSLRCGAKQLYPNDINNPHNEFEPSNVILQEYA
jgi:hypothetical protein